jgi:ribonuclease D
MDVLPVPELVVSAAQLRALVADLSLAEAVAVDTESNSLHAYRERVCLIQIALPERDVLVDPLAVDVSPLGAMFANPRCLKIFHAAEYDVLCLKRDFGFEVSPLFDTMVAARTLGRTQTGLAALLEQHFDVRLDKRFQRANWGHRPLTAAELDYARMDVHYLFDLRDLLMAELDVLGRREEAEEEFVRLSRLQPEPPRVDYDAFWRLPGARDLSPQQAAVLRALFEYRELAAERADVPAFKVIPNETLVALAERGPGDADGLRLIPGMTAGQIRRHGEALLAAIGQGQGAEPIRPPRPASEREEVRDRYDRLRVWRKKKAQTRAVESDVILPREALWELARRAPQTAEALAGMEHLGPWRRTQYGSEILAVIAAG